MRSNDLKYLFPVMIASVFHDSAKGAKKRRGGLFIPSTTVEMRTPDTLEEELA